MQARNIPLHPLPRIFSEQVFVEVQQRLRLACAGQRARGRCGLAALAPAGSLLLIRYCHATHRHLEVQHIEHSRYGLTPAGTLLHIGGITLRVGKLGGSTKSTLSAAEPVLRWTACELNK